MKRCRALEAATPTLAIVWRGDHPPPILVQRGCAPQQLAGGSLPIGILDSAEFEEESIRLEPGGRLYSYSDGITEAANDRSEVLRTEGFLQLIEHAPAGSLHEDRASCIGKLKRWCGPVPFADDISLLALEMQSAPS